MSDFIVRMLSLIRQVVQKMLNHPDVNLHCPGGITTSSRWLQLSSHICVWKGNHFTCWTLKGIQTCCWDVRTDATCNRSKLLDTERSPNGKFSSSRWILLDCRASIQNTTSSGRIQGNYLEICTESSWSTKLKCRLWIKLYLWLKSNIT